MKKTEQSSMKKGVGTWVLEGRSGVMHRSSKSYIESDGGRSQIDALRKVSKSQKQKAAAS